MAHHEIPLERRTLHGHFSRGPRADPDRRFGRLHLVRVSQFRLAHGRARALCGAPRRRTRRRARADRARPGSRGTGRADARGRDRRGPHRSRWCDAGRRLEHAAQRSARLRRGRDVHASLGARRGCRQRALGLGTRGRTAPVSRSDRDAAGRAGHPLDRASALRAAATSTARSSSPGRRSSSRSRSTARSYRRATGTLRRATARSRSSRSRRPWSGPSSHLRCATISR